MSVTWCRRLGYVDGACRGALRGRAGYLRKLSFVAWIEELETLRRDDGEGWSGVWELGRRRSARAMPWMGECTRYLPLDRDVLWSSSSEQQPPVELEKKKTCSFYAEDYRSSERLSYRVLPYNSLSDSALDQACSEAWAMTLCDNRQCRSVGCRHKMCRLSEESGNPRHSHAEAGEASKQAKLHATS